MKRILVLIIACAAFTGFARSEAPIDGFEHRDGVQANFGVFYSSLGQHGEWIELSSGYAWRPARVSHGWRPYLYGRWVWSDYGWYWASDEPFGWATYHYGRWYYDDYYGWIWIPGDTWGPAWVEWRYDDDYIGWAPLSPYASFDVGVGVTFGGGWSAPYNYWNFVPCRNFSGVRVADYVQPVDRTRRIFGSTRSVVDIRVDNGRVINRGVDVNFVERRGNVRVDRVDVVTRDRGEGERVVREGDRQRVEVFRPRLDAQIRNDVSRPENVRRAEHPIFFDRPAGQRNEAAPARPYRAPDPRRDTRIQNPGSMERRQAPEGRVMQPKPQERGISRQHDLRNQPRPDQGRIQRQQPARPPGFQERRAPAVRPGPAPRHGPVREVPRERPPEKRDKPPGERGR